MILMVKVVASIDGELVICKMRGARAGQVINACSRPKTGKTVFEDRDQSSSARLYAKTSRQIFAYALAISAMVSVRSHFL